MASSLVEQSDMPFVRRAARPSKSLRDAFVPTLSPGHGKRRPGARMAREKTGSLAVQRRIIQTGALPDCDAVRSKGPAGGAPERTAAGPHALANPGGKIYRVLREGDMLTPEMGASLASGGNPLRGLCRASAMALGASGRAAFCDLLAVDLTAWRHA
jgi:hypothetical protein